jgi:hypothetical protein
MASCLIAYMKACSLQRTNLYSQDKVSGQILLAGLFKRVNEKLVVQFRIFLNLSLNLNLNLFFFFSRFPPLFVSDFASQEFSNL